MSDPLEPPIDPSSGDGSHGGAEIGDVHERDLEHWRALTADEALPGILLRLERDVRIGLERRTIERMRAAAAMVDLDRLLLAAAVRLTYHAAEYTGATPLGPWVEAMIDQAIEDLVTEDAIAERDERPIEPDDPRYLRLALQLRTDPRSFRRASVVFHRLPSEERAAFWAVLVDGKSIEQHATEAHVPISVVRQRFDRAVMTFCSLGKRRDAGDGPPLRHGGRA